MALKLHTRGRSASASKVVLNLLAAACVLAVSGVSGAAPPTNDADASFEAGRVAAERGDFATACPKFAESLRLDPGAGTRMNLADCEERSGHLADAWRHWSIAVTELGPKDDRVAFASLRVAALDPHVPRLTIRLPAGTPAGTRVRCDDQDLGSPDMRAGISFSSSPLALNPGDHVVVVESPGRHSRDFRINLKARERSIVDVSVGPPVPAAAAPAPISVPAPAIAPEPASETAPPPLAPAPAPEPSTRGAKSTVGLAVGGAGVLAIAIAVVTGAETIRMKNVVTEHCNLQRTCDAEGLDAGASGKTLSVISTVAFTAGLVGLGAGTFLFLTDGTSGPRTTAGLLPGGRLGFQGSF